MDTLMLGWVLYAVATVFECILLSIRLSFHIRRYAVMPVLFLTVVGHTFIALGGVSAISIFFYIAGAYRVMNLMRFAYGRMHDSYLYSSTGRTSLVTGVIQAFIAMLAWLFKDRVELQVIVSTILFGAIVLLLAVLFYSLQKNIRNSRYTLEASHYSDAELPSVSVLIPARNETVDLADCLRSFTISNYKKLEILVLDDCSQDRTSDIIKKFAHDGVRFIQGSEPGEAWLPKNAAYEKLLREANGEILLFCGVDIRVDPNTIRQLAAELIHKDLTMLSVLPERPIHATRLSITQLLRYAWELTLPRKLTNRPPVLSSMWMMRRDYLLASGGFSSIKRKVVPESHFATLLAKTNKYVFLRSGSDSLVHSIKRPLDQLRTTVRVRYPQLHKRPENVLILTAVELLLLTHPLLLLAINDSLFMPYIIIYSIFLLIWAGVLSSAVSKHNRPVYILQALFVLPVDMILSNYSLIKYEFSHVDWKERNVCLPVMHVVPSLPKLDD